MNPPVSVRGSLNTPIGNVITVQDAIDLLLQAPDKSAPLLIDSNRFFSKLSISHADNCIRLDATVAPYINSVTYEYPKKPTTILPDRWRELVRYRPIGIHPKRGFVLTSRPDEYAQTPRSEPARQIAWRTYKNVDIMLYLYPVILQRETPPPPRHAGASRPRNLPTDFYE